MPKARTAAGRFVQSTAHELCTALVVRNPAERDESLDRFARENGLTSNDVLTCVVFEKVLRVESLATMVGGLPSLEQMRQASAEMKWAILAGCIRLLNVDRDLDVERPRIRPS